LDVLADAVADAVKLKHALAEIPEGVKAKMDSDLPAFLGSCKGCLANLFAKSFSHLLKYWCTSMSGLASTSTALDFSTFVANASADLGKQAKLFADLLPFADKVSTEAKAVTFCLRWIGSLRAPELLHSVLSSPGSASALPRSSIIDLVRLGDWEHVSGKADTSDFDRWYRSHVHASVAEAMRLACEPDACNRNRSVPPGKLRPRILIDDRRPPPDSSKIVWRRFDAGVSGFLFFFEIGAGAPLGSVA
jgi:hypothetical protein